MFFARKAEIGLLFLALLACYCSAAEVQQPLAKLPDALLPNAQWVSGKVIAGGTPKDPAGYAALAKLGVKTIVSVDGAAPNLVAAQRAGIRYVHLPHGYDQVPADRARQLAKVVRDLPGPIYIHCHHGRHRSPAAAAVACIGAGQIPPAAALGVLKSAGTSLRYQGLYQSATQAKPIEPEVLNSLPNHFPESCPAIPLVSAMVKLEHAIDRLQQLQQAAWQTPADHPDLDPVHEALLLRELFAELPRTTIKAGYPANFWSLAHQSEKNAQQLESALAAGKPATATKLLAAIQNDCRACHTQYRDSGR